MNFMFQDFLGTLLAVLLFPLVFLFTGYVLGRTLNLFDFVARTLAARLVIGIVLSFAISPIFTFLSYRLLSGRFTLLLLGLTAIAFAVTIFWKTDRAQTSVSDTQRSALRRLQRRVLWITGLLVLFGIFFLIDWQFGERLYFNIASSDWATRTQVIDAITRTGVPPVNPSYYPGHPEPLTFLYYFWYVLASLIDQVGGQWVNARTALFGSVIWCGLGLMATVALYLRLRRPEGDLKIWKTSLVGCGLLALTGLDSIPISAFLALSGFDFTRGFAGDIEHWNDQITAWMGAVSWVPHHVASIVACLAGLMLFQSVHSKKITHQVAAMVVAGLAFASAVGLSVWVALVFLVFWISWMADVVLRSRARRLAYIMLIPGGVALIALLPYLLDMLGSDDGPNKGPPLVFCIRRFAFVGIIFQHYPAWITGMVNFLVMPFNYFIELGFFFVAGLLWIDMHGQLPDLSKQFARVEMLLLGVTVVLVSFFRSNVISNNDFGWRGWMFGQFVLLIWGVDIIQFFGRKARNSFASSTTVFGGDVQEDTISFLAIGLLTTLMDVSLLRFWPLCLDAGVAGFPNFLSPDDRLGERTYAARQSYNFIDQNLPKGITVQCNPSGMFDRSDGLYRTRQAVIAQHTLFGVPANASHSLIASVGAIFEPNRTYNLMELDRECRHNAIDMLIVKDVDPLWKNIGLLEKRRPGLYRNRYYVLFPCGDYPGIVIAQFILHPLLSLFLGQNTRHIACHSNLIHTGLAKAHQQRYKK